MSEGRSTGGEAASARRARRQRRIARREEARRRYAAGEGVTELARAFGVTRQGVYRWLRGGIIEVRVAEREAERQAAGEAARAARRRWRCHELLTREEWWEAYWGGSRPGCKRLGELLGLNAATVRLCLTTHGIPVRSRAEAVREWWRCGRGGNEGVTCAKRRSPAPVTCRR